MRSVTLRLPLLCALFAGCASYVDRMAPVRADLRAGDPEAALRRLEQRFSPSDDDLVYFLERGLLLRYAGRFDESNAVFEQAERLADDLYTKSISLSLASLFTSDVVIPYEGEDFERVFINYFMALNYLDLGSFESALVECRKVQRKLQFYEERFEGSNKKYRTDPFVHYLMGLIQRASGELNDAYISFRKAAEGFRSGAHFGLSFPPPLADDLLTAATALSFGDHVEMLRREYPDARVREGCPGCGEVVVVVEVGFVPAKTEASLSVPILESEKGEWGVALAVKLRDRAYERRSWRRVHYWLRLALPAYPPRQPPPWAGVEVNEVEAFLVEDLDAVARASLDDRMGRVLLKAIARALAKYGLTTGTEDAVAKKHGEATGAAIGALLNLASVATERADLRAWLGLPREIYVVRLALPPGRHDLSVRLRGLRGGSLAESTVSVEVRQGSTTFVSRRFFT